MVSFVYSFIRSFIYSTNVFTSCYSVPGIVLGLRTREIRHSLPPHGDYHLVRESGITQRIRLMCASVPAVLWKHTDSMWPEDLLWSVSEEALLRGWASAETWRVAGINMTERENKGPWILVQPHHLAWAYASAPCMDSWSQRSFPTFFSTFASCSHCPKLLPLSLELPVEFSVFTASFFNLANSCWTPALPGAQSWALSCYCLWETFSSLYLFSLLYVHVVIIDLGFWFLSYRH